MTYKLSTLTTSLLLLTASGFTHGAVPTAPTSLVVTSVSTTQIDVSWVDQSSNETGFELERRPSTSTTYTRIATLAANAQSYRDSGLSEGTKYYYRVRAVNGSNSPYSNGANATTAITAPTDLTLSSVPLSLMPFQINLNWKDNSSAEAGYNIEEATAATGPWTQISSLSANITSYQRTGLASKKTYFYRVRAYSGTQNSDYTLTVSVTTAAPHTSTLKSPKGIYLLSDNTGKNGLASLQSLDKPYIDGFAWRIGWNSLDTGTSGPAYNFSAVDEAIAGVQALGKKLTIALFVLEMPTYVLNSAQQTWNAPGRKTGTTVLTVVPWDAMAMYHYRNFTQALGDHEVFDTATGTKVKLRDHSALGQINAGILGLQSVRDNSGTLVKHPGFTRQVFQQAMLDSTHAMQDQFPTKPNYVAFWGLDDGQQPKYADELLLNLLDEFDGAKNPLIGLFNEALKGDSPGLNYLQPANINGHFIMFQACGSWTLHDLCKWTAGDDSPSNGISYGNKNFGATYFEMYRNDLENPAFAPIFNQWNTVLAQ